ncbi:PREDICTED: lymphocyte antigen 6E [Chinchilla lanigera]|uniref:Lymphocyte antigen 6E n=1 Tax=Chinchilla lanigera TaxID=34839 RepID=A0A8C2VSC8_CHILA|nr:PREDICTED: lymphocyte antigen 6E [Chinchilla lanigera]XP_013375516.1 PREDICTED: lymphocyte antigen 6E [Chinchilla lanigera]
MSPLSSMKVFLPVLLAALLGVEQALSLMCFSCTTQKSNFYCLWPVICSNIDNYCVTLSTSAGIGKIVDYGYSLSKGCSPTCPGSISGMFVRAVDSRCCSTSLCNFSAARGGPEASTSLLSLGLLLSLLSAMLWLAP